MKSFIAAILVLFLCAGPVSAQSYHLTDLGPGVANAINASGQVVGAHGGTAFLYSGGIMTDLGTLPGTDSSAAQGINDSGQIVGYAVTNSDPISFSQHFYPFLYSGGTMTNLVTLSQSTSNPIRAGNAYAINNSGQIVGDAGFSNTNTSGPFMYSAGAFIKLGSGTGSVAMDINDSGQAVGYGTTALGFGNPFNAIIYNGATSQFLGSLSGSSGGSVGYAINNSGQVIGVSSHITPGTPPVVDSHAFLFSGGVMSDLGTVNDDDIESDAWGINASGQIVGEYLPGSFPRSYHAFLFHDGKMEDLNSLLDSSGDGLTLSLANAINDRGQIVGYGTDPDGFSHGFLLTPVPEPSAIILAALGFAGLWYMVRRRQLQRLQPRGLIRSRSFQTVPTLAVLCATGSILSAVQAQSFTGLGVVSGFTSESDANAISGDGSAVVGRCLNSSNNPDGFRWTKSTGMVALPTFSTAQGTSANGSVLVGSAFGSKGASRWTQPTGWVSLGHLTGGTTSSTTAQGVSGDGSVVVGTGGSTLGTQAFRWTQATGMIGLGDLPGGTFMSNASGISADNSTIVGYSDSGTGGEAFRWTQPTGMVGLGFLPTNLSDSFSAAQAVSADGSVIVGFGTAMDGQDDPFRWTQATGMVDLGGGAGLALATSADGSIVVGEGESGAFIWDMTHGMRNLQSMLTNDYHLGNSLAGWYLRRGTGLSADGSAIVGWGINPSGNYEAWIVNVPEPSAFLMAALAVVALFGHRYLIIGSHQLVNM